MNNTKVFTLGCRLNFFESELINHQLDKHSIENTIVVNTCNVTNKAHKNSIKKIKKIKKNYPQHKIFATGCAVTLNKDTYENLTELDGIILNNNKLTYFEKNNIDNDKTSLNIKENYEDSFYLPELEGFHNKTRAFLQIQQGCDHRCSFCVIHIARGNNKSLSNERIISQVKQLVKFGHKEIVLTGVDISSWQRDIKDKNSPSQLGKLCLSILENVKDLKRLRVSSLDPAVIDIDIIHLLKNEERFMPHIHLSLQSLNDRVLHNMGRRHSQQQAIEWMQQLKESNKKLILGADLIAGFPRETYDQHLDTYNTIKKINIPLLHVFPFSPQKNTPALLMKQVSEKDKKIRVNMLQELSKTIKYDIFTNLLNESLDILFENNKKGYTHNYLPVNYVGKDSIKSNYLTKMTVTGFNNQCLLVQ